MAEDTRTAARKAIQERQRAWLQEVMRLTQRRPAQLAAEAKVSDTTLTRLLNNPDYTGTLNQITIERIARTFNVPGPEDLQAQGRKGLLGFTEAERFDHQRHHGELAPILNAMLQGRPAGEVWTLRSTALEAAGYLPGDLLIVDPTQTPKANDAVCAVVMDWQRGAAETVFRIYQPPFLIGAGLERLAYKPLLMDGDRVILKGPVACSLRPHSLAQAGS